MAQAGANMLSVFEAEAYAKMIGPITVAEVGSKSFMRQHDLVEQLNIQAHKNALTKHDEFVLEALLAAEKIPALVHHLLAVEAWRENVFPLLRPRIQPAASIKTYMCLYHEATVCNLLEVLLYHESAAEAGGDAMGELADYCYRKLLRLANRRIEPPRRETADDIRAQLKTEQASVPRQLTRQAKEIEYSTAMCSITIMRFLTEHVERLPLNVPRQFYNGQDILMLLVPLVESAPWQRRSKKGIEKYVENKWTPVQRSDRFRLCKAEGQVWLTVYNLLMDKRCATLYEFTDTRKASLMRLKRYLNDLLKDQLPVLRDVHRMLEELAIKKPPPPKKTFPLIVPVPRIRTAVYADAKDDGKRWREVAEEQLKDAFNGSKKERMAEIKAMARTYAGGAMEGLLEEPKCARCGKPATKRCSGCQHEWYCSRKCQLKSWKKHKKNCEILAKAMRSRDGLAKTEAEQKATKARGGGARDDDIKADDGKQESKVKTQPKIVMLDDTANDATDAKIDAARRVIKSDAKESATQDDGVEDILELEAAEPEAGPSNRGKKVKIEFIDEDVE